MYLLNLYTRIDVTVIYLIHPTFYQGASTDPSILIISFPGTYISYNSPIICSEILFLYLVLSNFVIIVAVSNVSMTVGIVLMTCNLLECSVSDSFVILCCFRIWRCGKVGSLLINALYSTFHFTRKGLHYV